MPSGRGKLAEPVERLPLDTALKTAVVEGINHTDNETAGREAKVLRDFLDELPRDLQAVRDAVARDRRRRTGGTSIQESSIPPDGSSKATSYARENPGKVASGVAAIALGAGLIYAALNRHGE